MSLEQTLERTNELLSQIVTILQTGVSAPAELGAPAAENEKTTRAKKTQAPEGTVYWSIPKFNSVFAQEPGMDAPTIEGAVQIAQEEYEAKKSDQKLRIDQLLERQRQGTTTGATDAKPSANTQPSAEAQAANAQQPSTTAASSTTQPAGAGAASSAAAGDVPFADVLAAAKAVNGVPEKGRELLVGVLKQFLPNDPQPTVTKLQALGRNAECKKALEACLPTAEAEFDPLA